MGNLHFKYNPHWHESAIGQQLIQTIEHQLNKSLPFIFGNYLLQLGKEEYTHWLQCSPIQQKILISDVQHHTTSHEFNQIHSKFEKLPFPENSMDVVILPCILETLEKLDAILTELWRVLSPGGTLILFGFNPFSTWGLTHLFLKHHDEFPWQGRYWPRHKIISWLKKTNFQIDSTKYFYFRPPCSSSLHNKLHFLEKIGAYCYYPLGGLYQIIATKQIVSFTPIKAQWEVPLVGSTLINPTSQTYNK